MLSDDLAGVESDPVSWELQTAEAGFVPTIGVGVGDDILIVGDLAYNLWAEAASATIHCAP